ncbi:alpha amylase C-terminal domain-containing protein [Microbacteriaceae bacterium]|nr:alpha amylase C-terminal domain-containing protein [Candidatus Saccharibacteria bacterium]
MSHQVKKNVGVKLHSGGATFRVWAPFAENVSLRGTFSEGQELPMTSEKDGYWTIQIDKVSVGHTYKYIIQTTDGTILEKNDPRARALTNSDNGESVITENEFEWKVPSFTAPHKDMQVIYELHIGTFNRPDEATPGTFYTAIEKLDYLVELGATTIELMPVTSMAFGYGWGYAPNYIFSVESMLGGRHGLLSFVDACHQRGISVILDVVYNHFFPTTDLWQFDGWSENDRGGIYFYNDERGDTPWGGRPDYGRAEVRQFILDNVTMWLSEYQLDGLRIDSTIYMRNTEGRDGDPTHDIPEAWSLLQEITHLAHQLNPNAVIIAEDAANSPDVVRDSDSNGAGFDAQWALGFPHAIRDAFGLKSGQAQTLDTLVYQLEHATFSDITFSDSHDTAANGSKRLNQEEVILHTSTKNALKKQILAATITLTTPGIPMLLQGSEFLQPGAFNDWQALDWNRSEHYNGIILAHRHLIDLRLNRHSTTKGLTGASIAIIHRNDEQMVVAYHRWSKGGEDDDVIVVVNCGYSELIDYHFNLPYAGDWKDIFYSAWSGYSSQFKTQVSPVFTAKDADATLSLAPLSAVIIARRDSNISNNGPMV